MITLFRVQAAAVRPAPLNSLPTWPDSPTLDTLSLFIPEMHLTEHTPDASHHRATESFAINPCTRAGNLHVPDL